MFGWRGREALHGRTLLAIVLGSAIFGLLVLLIRVEGSQQAIGFREAGRLTVLTPESTAHFAKCGGVVHVSRLTVAGIGE